MNKQNSSKISLHVRRGARRTQVIACGAPAMLLAIAFLVIAVALAAYWLHISINGASSNAGPRELPTAVDRVGPR